MPPRIRHPFKGSLREVSRSTLTTTHASVRPFTCSSCLAQQQQQPPPSPSSASLESPSSTSYSPIPQRRLPRWAATPDRMRAPVSLKQNDPKNRYNVNENPKRLDRAYVDVFGPGGEELLTEDVKWLAVTHKSFDQGRRGYNDRLAYLGKRIVDLQTSLAILAQPTESLSVAEEVLMEPEMEAEVGAEAGAEADVVAAKEAVSELEAAAEVAEAGEEIVEQPAVDGRTVDVDEFGRRVFRHPAMDIVGKLTREIRLEHSRQSRIAGLALDFGLAAVVRWKPRSAQELVRSGQNFVLAQALYAMIGALALQKGGDVAVKAVRARILPRLGLKV